jgi:hypothetical protein
MAPRQKEAELSKSAAPAASRPIARPVDSIGTASPQPPARVNPDPAAAPTKPVDPAALGPPAMADEAAAALPRNDARPQISEDPAEANRPIAKTPEPPADSVATASQRPFALVEPDPAAAPTNPVNPTEIALPAKADDGATAPAQKEVMRPIADTAKSSGSPAAPKVREPNVDPIATPAEPPSASVGAPGSLPPPAQQPARLRSQQPQPAKPPRQAAAPPDPPIRPLARAKIRPGPHFVAPNLFDRAQREPAVAAHVLVLTPHSADPAGALLHPESLAHSRFAEPSLWDERARSDALSLSPHWRRIDTPHGLLYQARQRAIGGECSTGSTNGYYLCPKANMRRSR